MTAFEIMMPSPPQTTATGARTTTSTTGTSPTRPTQNYQESFRSSLYQLHHTYEEHSSSTSEGNRSHYPPLQLTNTGHTSASEVDVSRGELQAVNASQIDFPNSQPDITVSSPSTSGTTAARTGGDRTTGSDESL